MDAKVKRYYQKMKGVRSVSVLDFTDYNKRAVKDLIQKELDWRDYGGKHYESIWTRFYQGYILPTKFKIDKRKAHLSTLICSGQISREEALEEMKVSPYDAVLLKKDKEFVLKKLDLSEGEFEAIMMQKIRDHREFDTEGSFFHYYPLLNPLKPLWEKFKLISGYHKKT